MRRIVWLVTMMLVGCGSDTPDASDFAPTEPDPSGAGSAPGQFAVDGSVPRDAGPSAVATDVEAVVTTDNAFSFGYGSDANVSTFIRGEGSDGAGIFNCPVGYGPDRYVVPAAKAPIDAWLYIIAWADTAVTQGTLAQFKRVGGEKIYSGNGAWEVCAIGQAYDDHGPGPDQAAVNARVVDCNKGHAGTAYSKGWVTVNGASTRTAGAIGKLAVGEANDNPSGNFPIVCQKDDKGVAGIDAVARWMWFDPLDGKSPFVGNENNRTKTFLIFRLPASALPSVTR